ncbi:MAG: protein phosphatase 2C domain-containing protein [Pseudomonadota bacterium]
MTDLTRVRYTAQSHRGHVRNVNEDSVLSLPEYGIWVVSDGMGGHLGGDYASQTVVEAVATIAPDEMQNDVVGSVQRAIQTAHHTIQGEADRIGTDTIGATVVVLMLAVGRFGVLWSGDSRVYRLRRGMLEMLTTDHSEVAELVLAGKMDWDEAERSPWANAITNAVGIGDDPELEFVHGTVQSGDRFLLCSDGLTKYADSETLRRVLCETGIEKVCDRLLGIALDGGGADNISIVVVEVP